MKSLKQIREASGGKEAYQKFFKSILKKFGVDSPSELDGKKKKDFFDAIDKGWDGDNEKAESVQEASKLTGGRGKAEIDINWLGSSGDAKFISTKYKIKIKKTSNGAILSGDKQKILAYLQGKEYDMDAEDIKDLYPELVETYDDPDDYESEKDVTLNPDEDPLATGKSLGEANSALLKKAQAIASKLSGNMTKAVAEIEKLKKGLSDDKKVMSMLKLANEDVNEAKKKPVSQMTPAEKKADAEKRKEYNAYQKSNRNEDSIATEAYIRAVDFEKTSKEIGKLKSGVDQNAIKQIAKYFNVMFKNSSLKIRDDAVLAVNKLKSKLSRDTRVEIDKILTTNNLMKNGNIMVEGSMKKNPAIDNNPEVKAARKAHAGGYWDGNVDKNGEAIVHIKGKPYTVTNNNESVEEAKMSGKEKKHYASLMRIALAGRKANPDFTSSIASNGDFVVSDRGNVVARLKKGTFKYFHQMKESVEEAVKLKGGKGNAKIDIKWMGKPKLASDAAKKYNITIKPHSQGQMNTAGAVVTGDKQKILNYLQGKEYEMSVDDIDELYPELMEARLDKADYDAIAKMETGGYRPKVVNKETGKAMYVAGVYFKDEKSAKGHAQAYLDGYAAAGERRASKATAAYNKSNASKIKESVDEAAKVLSKKGDYVFSTYKNSEVDVTYKGKIIATGDFDSGADAWFLDIKGAKGQQSFNSANDVIKFFMKNKITEAVSVDRRTTGFKEALKRRAEAKAKRESMKIKAAKKQSKADMAKLDANYAYESDVEEIIANANKKIMGEDAPANASSSGAVDMNPTGKSKKKDKESLVTRAASLMAKRGY
jgi:hypothetical protein